jgi:hypothetical protein
MHPDPPPALLEQIERWAALSRWERAEVGRALRRLGWSYGDIRAVVDVPKGTLAGWCRDIRLSPEQIAAIAQRGQTRRGVPEIARIEADAREFAVAHLHEPLFVAGTTLYWGEGDKTKRTLALTNSDPAALRLFIAWTFRFHGHHGHAVQFVLSLHLHAEDDDDEARRWWAATLGLAAPDFTRTFVKPAGTGHRSNRLKHGVCRVRMRRSTDAYLRTMTWIAMLSERLAPPQRTGE